MSAATTSGAAAAPVPTTDNVLEVRDLQVAYGTPRGSLQAVDGVSFDLAAGESLGIVGESGCGKSSLGRGLLQLLPPGAAVGGSVRLRGEELIGVDRGRLRRARGEDIALVFQEPMTRLNPLMRVSEHFVEAIRAHRRDISKADAKQMGRDVLAQMGIPPTRADNYPHEFSGGMRQRIMIALGIVLHPGVIVADEPTTALDVIVEAQIIDLLDRMRAEENVGLLLITHNLGLVAETCDRVAVMYAGRIVEIGPVASVFAQPQHPYTQGLLASVISIETTKLVSIEGSPPDLVDPPKGCRFAARCSKVFDDCRVIDPRRGHVGEDHEAACLLHTSSYPGAMT